MNAGYPTRIHSEDDIERIDGHFTAEMIMGVLQCLCWSKGNRGVVAAESEDAEIVYLCVVCIWIFGDKPCEK